MRRYEKYKDSGIEWIGEIPEHWESIRLKYIGYLYGGLAGKSANDFNQESNFNNKSFIPFTNICNNKIIDPNQLQQVVIEENEQQNQVAKGDLFFMMSSENFDDVGKSSILLDDLGETYLNSFCKGFRFTKDKYYPPFVNYQLLSKAYRSLVLTEANGYTRINLKIDKINDIPLKTPPTLDEQIAIANYLDQKTSEIEELIKQKEELLLLFEEEKTVIINQIVTKGTNPNVKIRDSKFEWLGEIPDHWELKKMKYIIKGFESGVSVNSMNNPIIDNENGILKTSCVYNYTFRPEENKMILNDLELKRARTNPRKGMIIISRMNTPELVGASGYVEKDYPNLFLPDRLWQTVFHENIKINSKWLSFILKSINFRNLLSTLATGTSPSMKNIGQEDVLNIFIPFPLVEEQELIVRHIEIEISRIEKKVEKTKCLIEQLKEYKTALISEVATGKFNVID